MKIAAEEYKQQIGSAIEAAKENGTVPDIAGRDEADDKTLV